MSENVPAIVATVTREIQTGEVEYEKYIEIVTVSPEQTVEQLMRNLGGKWSPILDDSWRPDHATTVELRFARKV